jgi:hypothetical protein
LLDEEGARESVGVLSTTEVIVMTPPSEVVMKKVGVEVGGGGGGGGWEESLVVVREVEAEVCAEEGADEVVRVAMEVVEGSVGMVLAAVVLVLIHRFVRCKGINVRNIR